MIDTKKYDVFVNWRINVFCNFNCKYCFISLKDRKNPKYLGPSNIDKIIDFFKKTNLKFLIHMSGGEPFLCPDFIKLCEFLTKKHYISINTNLTTNLVYDFAKRIDPKKVEFIHCSLHISERERLNLKEDFIKKFKILEQTGFNIFVSQVMYPENLKEFDKIFNYFKNEGIIIIPKVFRGVYKRKQYPLAYTQKEKEKLSMFRKIKNKERIKNKHIFFSFDKEPIGGLLSFRGLPCSAGKKFIVIEYDGTIKRCWSENTYLGNIFKGQLKLFDKNKPCISEICKCPFFGLAFTSESPRLITKQSPITKQSSENFLEKFVYPHTTPLLKPVRKIIRKILYNVY